MALSAINALAVHLGGLADRRKTLVVVTEGIGRAERRRGQEYLPTLDTVIRSANRANVAIYPFDPGGDAATTPAARGAAPARDRDRRRGDRRRSGRRPAARRRRLEPCTTCISFRAAHPDDGQFRALEARVTRPGVRLRAPKGLLGRVAGRSAARGAARPDERAEEGRAARAGAARQPAHPAVVRDVARSGRQSRVTFVWEPAARVPGERVRRAGVARSILTARSSDGTVLFEGPVAPTGAGDDRRAGRDAVARGLRRCRRAACGCGCRFRTPPRSVLDQDVREISVRDLRGDVAIGTPRGAARAQRARVPRARRRRRPCRSRRASSAAPSAC